MTRFSVQARDGIFIKGYGFLSFADSMGRNIRKIIRIKYSQKLFDHAKQSAIDALKTSYKKKSFKKKWKQLVILLEIKLLIKLPESQKIHHSIIWKKMSKY